NFVHFLYQIPAFGAFDDFSDFLESISCETSKSCQVRGSNPCRGAKPRGAESIDLNGLVVIQPIVDSNFRLCGGWPFCGPCDDLHGGSGLEDIAPARPRPLSESAERTRSAVCNAGILAGKQPYAVRTARDLSLTIATLQLELVVQQRK